MRDETSSKVGRQSLEEIESIKEQLRTNPNLHTKVFGDFSSLTDEQLLSSSEGERKEFVAASGWI